MRALLFCVTAFLAAPAPGAAAQEGGVADPSSFTGSWIGTLDAGDGVQLRLRLVVSEGDGVLSVPEFSVERWNWETRRSQTERFRVGAPIATLNGHTISVTLSTIEASYTGTFSPAHGRITGAFTQWGETFPLVLKQSSEDEGQPRRPQTPEQPFPYLAEDVTYPNPDGGHTLAGTFTRPTSGGPFPAVILISGSGPNDRDVDGSSGHRPFLVLADHLTRRGIAVLRYDDRGVGESTGDFAAATTENFASDALAGVAYLKDRDDVDPGKIGLAGHSEGGVIAPMAAVRSPDIGYIVLMAGPGVNGERVFHAQAALNARADGASEEAIAEIRKRQRAIFEILKSESDPEGGGEAIAAIIRPWLENASVQERALYGIANDTKLETAVEALVQRVSNPWQRYFLTHEPAEVLERVSVPVLAINGTKDLYVPHEENLRAIEAALKRGGNTRYEIHAPPDLNHFFQHAVTGTASESETIEETVAVEVMELIAQWILSVTM